MRVLHVYSGNLWGGIEAMLVAIARGQGGGESDVHEFALCFRDRLAAEVGGTGAIVHELGAVRLRAPWSILNARRTLAGILDGGAFDAVVYHAAWVYALLGGTKTPPRTRTVFWMHDVATGLHWTERLSRWVGAPARLVSNSDFTGASASALWPGARATTVHCPGVFEPRCPAGTRQAVRAEIGSDDLATVLIQVGRLEPWKGHLMLLDALAALRDIPDWEYWIVGGAQRPAEEAYVARLRAQAEHAGLSRHVRFLGQRTDVHRLLAAADAFCQPSAAPEPFGVAVVEALAAGLPVIATTPGGVAEIVDDHCGGLVRRERPEEMTVELRRLLFEPERRRALGEAGPARARSVADPARQLHRLHEAIFGSVVSGHAG